MISNIFYPNTIKDLPENDIYKYEEFYLMYLFIAEMVKKNKTIFFYDYVGIVNDKYGCNTNRTSLRLFVETHFKGIDKYKISQKQIDAIKLSSKFKNDLFFLQWDSEEKLRNNLNEFFNNSRFDISKAIKYVLSIYKKDSKRTEDEIIARYFDIVYNKEDYERNIDYAFESIDDSYLKLPISFVIKNNTILKLLFANEINNIFDLKNTNLDFILTVFSPDIELCINSLKNLSYEKKENFLTDLNNFFSSLSSNEKEVITLRNGFDSKALSLEAVGEKIGVTRERVRQIEKKAMAKLKKNVSILENQINALFYEITNGNNTFIEKKMIVNNLGNEYISNIVIFIINNYDLTIKYSYDYDILYNSQTSKVSDFVDAALAYLGDFVEIDRIEQNDFYARVIEKHYKKYGDRYYINRSIQTRDLICNVIDDNFPDGYSIGSDDDYLKLKNSFNDIYGVEDDFQSSRAIVGLIERMDYCLIDKGKYKRKKYCASIPDDLVEEIINYILLNGPMVFYTGIYSKFEEKLNNLGVKNQYYLKGLIDPLLPSEFTTKRDYINTTQNNMSSTEMIKRYINSFEGKFSIDDLRDKFKGVKDYTFYGALYSEANNGLIFLSNKKYVHINNLHISKEVIKEFEYFIDRILDSIKEGITSSNKIYAKLSLTNNELLEKLKVAEDSFSTYSLIKYLFSNKYGFNRPLISKDINSTDNQLTLIVNYANSLDSFNLKAINNYSAKMNIRGIYSYLYFMEDMSDSYVQINKDTMIKKEILDINSNQLKDIDELIILILDRFGKIDTRTFSGYQMLPKLKYVWNKYLLVGIIRSFFSDKYEIENTETTYDLTDFIIRRCR